MQVVPAPEPVAPGAVGSATATPRGQQRFQKTAVVPTTREGPFSVQLALKVQSGVFGTALRMTKVTSLALFPGPEARFEGQDSERDPVVFIDPAGMHCSHLPCRQLPWVPLVLLV